jgi:acyl carrier protein
VDIVEIYARMTATLRDVLDNDDVVATPELTAKQVKGWDSLAHIRIVLSVEQAFRVRFSAAEVSKLNNVGDFAALIQSKLKP